MAEVRGGTTRRRLLASAAAAGLVLPALPLDAAPVTGVVATTSMIADAARVVGDGRADVTALMGPGIDPHSYRQTRTDILAMRRAGLVLAHGLYLEAQMEDFLGDLAGVVPVRLVGEAVDPARLLSHADYKGRYDPHVWMDPALWREVVGAVEAALAEVDPDGREIFAANAEAYGTEIGALGDYCAEVLASVPKPARVLVTAHDAFGYFGRAFGFEVIGIQGISTESEAGLARIRTIVERLVADRIGAVFVESSVSDRNIRALIEGAAAEGHAVRIGGELYSDAMGLPGTYEGTYLGMIDHNVTTIAAALGGTVPERGRIGRLSGETRA